jgi:hypothetical protein
MPSNRKNSMPEPGSGQSASVDLEPFNLRAEGLTRDENGTKGHAFIFNAYATMRERRSLAGSDMNEAAIVYEAQKFLYDRARLKHNPAELQSKPSDRRPRIWGRPAA